MDMELDLCVVILAHAARDLVAAEVEGLELDLVDAELLRRRVVLHELLQHRNKHGSGKPREADLG
jgi:hypothetical protein